MKTVGNKYFLINLDTEVRNNGSITKIWLCKVMSEKKGWQVTKSTPLNPPLHIGGKLFSCNHRHIVINSVIELALDLFVVKIKLPVEFNSGEKCAKMKRM